MKIGERDLREVPAERCDESEMRGEMQGLSAPNLQSPANSGIADNYNNLDRGRVSSRDRLSVKNRSRVLRASLCKTAGRTFSAERY